MDLECSTEESGKEACAVSLEFELPRRGLKLST